MQCIEAEAGHQASRQRMKCQDGANAIVAERHAGSRCPRFASPGSPDRRNNRRAQRLYRRPPSAVEGDDAAGDSGIESRSAACRCEGMKASALNASAPSISVTSKTTFGPRGPDYRLDGAQHTHLRALL